MIICKTQEIGMFTPWIASMYSFSSHSCVQVREEVSVHLSSSSLLTQPVEPFSGWERGGGFQYLPSTKPLFLGRPN